MSRQIILGRGSKRRVRAIRWKPRELVAAIVVVACVLLVGVTMAVWVVMHYPD